MNWLILKLALIMGGTFRDLNGDAIPDENVVEENFDITICAPLAVFENEIRAQDFAQALTAYYQLTWVVNKELETGLWLVAEESTSEFIILSDPNNLLPGQRVTELEEDPSPPETLGEDE